MELSISILELRSWVEDKLTKEGINTVDQLVSSMRSGELMLIDGIGAGALSEITSCVIVFLSGDLAKRKAQWEGRYTTASKIHMEQAAAYRKILRITRGVGEYDS